MISPSTSSEPRRRLNICFGKLFVTDNVAKPSFDANKNSCLPPRIFIARKRNLAIESDELPHFTPNRARYAAGPVWNQRVYKKTARTGLTSSSPDPFSSRGGEGELDQQSLRDIAQLGT